MQAEAIIPWMCPGPPMIYNQVFPIRRKLDGDMDLVQMHLRARGRQAIRSALPGSVGAPFDF